MTARGLWKPEYIYRPGQLFRRLFRQIPREGAVETRLPWGAALRVRANDEIGSIVCTLGVFDLTVTEALWRLADPGETAVDAGANMGYMTAVLGHRVSPGGTVYSFEPHPAIFRELQENVELQRRTSTATFHPINAALGETPGTLSLRIPPHFAENRGVASIATGANAATPGDLIDVPARVLDEELKDVAAIGVMKIDVEGFELPVLHGAKTLLHSRRIREIIFEHHEAYPSEVAKYLEGAGMTLFRLHREFRRPVLLPPDSPVPRTHWEATSYIATFDPARVRERFAPSGWKCLG
jgi:FkbM family methyltransferase